MRCFIAILLPPSSCDILSELKEKFMVCGGDVKWVAKENYHLTLKFLGEIDDCLITDLSKEIEQMAARYQPFFLNLKRVGCFPKPDKPRVIWAGLQLTEKDRRSLNDMVKEIEFSLKKLGVPIDDKKFSPHITLGRVRTEKNQENLRKALQETIIPFNAPVKIEKIYLMESRLKPQGPEYFPLKEVPLGKRN